MSSRYHLHLRYKPSPVGLLREVHLDVFTIWTDWHNSTHTGVVHWSPFVLGCGYRGFHTHSITNFDQLPPGWKPRKQWTTFLFSTVAFGWRYDFIPTDCAHTSPVTIFINWSFLQMRHSRYRWTKQNRFQPPATCLATILAVARYITLGAEFFLQIVSEVARNMAKCNSAK